MFEMAAARMLCELLKGSRPAEVILLAELVVRASTGRRRPKGLRALRRL